MFAYIYIYIYIQRLGQDNRTCLNHIEPEVVFTFWVTFLKTASFCTPLLIIPSHLPPPSMSHHVLRPMPPPRRPRRCRRAAGHGRARLLRHRLRRGAASDARGLRRLAPHGDHSEPRRWNGLTCFWWRCTWVFVCVCLYVCVFLFWLIWWLQV